MDGEAEWYEGVTVTFIAGRTAVMTIFDEGKEKEKVMLSNLRTKKEMHDLMLEKGFVRKSPEAIAKQDEERKMKEEGEAKKVGVSRLGLKSQREKERAERLAQRENRWTKKREEREMQVKERELLGKSAPSAVSWLCSWVGHVYDERRQWFYRPMDHLYNR